MRKVLFLMAFVLGVTNIYCQTIEELQKCIESRDAQIKNIKKFNKDLVNLQKEQLDDYKILTGLMKDSFDSLTAYKDENKNLKRTLHGFNVLTSPDTLVFHEDLTVYRDMLPECLKERVEIIESIVNLRMKIESLCQKAQELEELLKNTDSAYAVIQQAIDPDVKRLLALIKKIDGMNLSLLSPEQRKYFRPGLTDEYNKFEKYY